MTDRPALPPEGAAYGAPASARPPFSRFAIWGFVVSCVSLLIFGFIGILGVVLSAKAFSDARRGTVRGRGLAIAGMIVGALGFIFYAVGLLLTINN